MQLACLVLAILWLGTIAWWRLSHVAREQYVERVEADRNATITKAKGFEDLVGALRRERDDAVEAQLAAEQRAASLDKNSAAQRTENVQLNSDLDAALTVNAALLSRLRTNLNAKRPAPWKATVATLLQEFQS